MLRFQKNFNLNSVQERIKKKVAYFISESMFRLDSLVIWHRPKRRRVKKAGIYRKREREILTFFSTCIKRDTQSYTNLFFYFNNEIKTLSLFLNSEKLVFYLRRKTHKLNFESYLAF